MKANTLISCLVTAQQICLFVLHVQKAGFLMMWLKHEWPPEENVIIIEVDKNFYFERQEDTKIMEFRTPFRLNNLQNH